ncbi:hypothetical protein [Paraglaciecola sp. MB-3u-78]|uniref:hypothetical protein n=1 Tax=Paraglaciecola sp. MB-3u-78 TaxID=2058332 RepID=UPI000C34A802|nr:hypothetical protein [Paraglaciecola sp. MB-3u-78]PKG97774.1 hypothetical protein CXF95_15120 [Paraglaciecola sp. MB-3u-78]
MLQKWFDLEDAKGAIEVMNKAGKLLKENGITLQYHAHGYEFLPHGTGTLLDYILEDESSRVMSQVPESLCYLKNFDKKMH